VLGARSPSAVDVQTLRASVFWTFIVRGEAEKNIPPTPERSRRGRPVDLIPGITFRRRGEIVRNPDAPVILDLDELPMPAFSPLPRDEELPLCAARDRTRLPVWLRVCSTNGFFRRRFRLKSPQRVIEQMRSIPAGLRHPKGSA